MDLTNVQWRKSSYSGTNGGECVEVAQAVNGVALRDSKNPDAGALVLSQAGFETVLATVRAR